MFTFRSSVILSYWAVRHQKVPQKYTCQTVHCDSLSTTLFCTFVEDIVTDLREYETDPVEINTFSLGCLYYVDDLYYCSCCHRQHLVCHMHVTVWHQSVEKGACLNCKNTKVLILKRYDRLPRNETFVWMKTKLRWGGLYISRDNVFENLALLKQLHWICQLRQTWHCLSIN